MTSPDTRPMTPQAIGTRESAERCPKHAIGPSIVFDGIETRAWCGFAMGCPSYRDGPPLAMPGDPIDGDTYATFAMPFFASYCLTCHNSALMGDDRNGAPPGRNWDDETAVRMYLMEMRLWVGELNIMPLGDGPKPTCDERRRLVRWIDAAAP